MWTPVSHESQHGDNMLWIVNANSEAHFCEVVNSITPYGILALNMRWKRFFSDKKTYFVSYFESLLLTSAEVWIVSKFYFFSWGVLTITKTRIRVTHHRNEADAFLLAHKCACVLRLWGRLPLLMYFRQVVCQTSRELSTWRQRREQG